MKPRVDADLAAGELPAASSVTGSALSLGTDQVEVQRTAAYNCRMADDATTEPSDEAKAETLRLLIHEENQIRNQTFTWFIALNGFLFAALGFAWSKSTDIVYVLAALGVVSSVSWAAHTVVQDLAIKNLRSRVPSSKAVPVGMTTAALSEMGHWYYRWLPHLYPWRVMPRLLGAAWVAVIFVRALQ